MINVNEYILFAFSWLSAYVYKQVGLPYCQGYPSARVTVGTGSKIAQVFKHNVCFWQDYPQLCSQGLFQARKKSQGIALW